MLRWHEPAVHVGSCSSATAIRKALPLVEGSAALGGKGLRRVQHHHEMWYSCFHTPDSPVSAFLSPLLRSTLSSLWYRLSQSQSTFLTIPPRSGLVSTLREVSSLEMSLGRKNMENPIFRGATLFTNKFAPTDSPKVRETMPSFVWGILHFTCCASGEEGAPRKALQDPARKLLFCLHSLQEAWRKISFV